MYSLWYKITVKGHWSNSIDLNINGSGSVMDRWDIKILEEKWFLKMTVYRDISEQG